jgi:large subunit ribosomal protein L10
MANSRNDETVETLRRLLDGVSTFFLIDYQGLSAGEIGVLRADVRSAGGRILIAKNTLINVVLKEQGYDGFDETLKGPTALVLIDDDPVAPVKAITDYAKGSAKELPTAKGGVMQGTQVDAEALDRIASLPSREQILSEVLGVLLAPLQQLVGVLEGPQRNLASVLNNYSEKLKEA